jgi:hypothetical protein
MTVESALRLDIDELIRRKAIQPGVHLGGEMKFLLDDDELAIEFEAKAVDLRNSWLRLRNTLSSITGAANGMRSPTSSASPHHVRISAGCDGG